MDWPRARRICLILPVPTVLESGKNEPGPLPRHRLPERLSPVPGAAHHGPFYSALVRRDARRLERLPAVFPSRAAGRIRVRPLAAKRALDSPGTAGRVPGVSPGGAHPAGHHGKPVRANLALAGDHRRRAVLPALGDCAPAAEMARIGAVALATLRSVQFRVLPRTPKLSVPGRALCPPESS